MDSLKSRFRPESFYQQYKPNIKIDSSFNFRTLAELPTEMILCISDFLPLIDLICFSLCNHRLRAIIQRKTGECQWTPTHDDKLVFLTRLERDSPAYFACDVCNVLHQFDGSESFGLSGTCNQQTCQLPCVQSGKWFSVPFVMDAHMRFDHSLCRLSFLQIKLAMRRFYYGPSAGISTDSLSYTQVRDYGERFLVDSESLWLFSIEATICPKPLGLYIRMQDIVMVKCWKDLFYLTYPNRSPIYAFRLCRHMRFYQYIALWVASFLRGEATNEIRSSEERCARCDVDYHVKAFEFDSHPTIIVTRWLNLGVGLTRDDPSWKLQACPYWRTDEELLEIKENVSPRLCFETMGFRSLEELNSHNLKYLRDEKYKEKMQFSSWKDQNHFRYGRPYHLFPTDASFVSDAWYISFSEPSNTKKIFKKLLCLITQSFFFATSADGSDTEKADPRLLCRDSVKLRKLLSDPRDHSVDETEATKL
ncbi:hypothetical protein N7540_010562 [Penicillium herquei]|nr:hypothetical protein N7540_010562 [Penicillium herquei]